MKIESRAEARDRNKQEFEAVKSRDGWIRARARLALESVVDAGSATEAFARLRWWTRSLDALNAEAYDVEDAIRVAGNEVWRLLLQESFDARGMGDVGTAIEIEVEGEDRRRLSNKREHGWIYKSQFGPVTVQRRGYGAAQQKSVHPLDEELNLPSRHHSYVLQERVSRLAARGPFDEVVDEIAFTTAAKVAKRQVEEIVEETTIDFDAFYREQSERLPPPEQTGSILVAGIDCKGVARRRTAEEKETPPRKHLSKGQKRQKKKMATVASVHTTEPHPRTAEQVTAALMDDGAPKAAAKAKPSPEHRRLWASVLKSKDDVIKEVAEEMQRRAPEQNKTAVCLMDGERALKTRAVKHLRSVFIDLILILDILHVLSYLWKAAHVFHEEGSEDARLWVRDRLLKILDGKVSTVVAGMRQSATKRQLTDEEREPADIACDYFLRNKDRMRYDEYLRQGLPIASGTAEGACGHLVKDRMELTGACWDVYSDPNRADAVLKLRALDKSGDLRAYWDFHMTKEKERNYGVRWKVAS